MSDLISRSEMRKHILNMTGMFTDELGFVLNSDAVIGAIETVPTIDAVKVVRCKDCKHRGFAGECPMCYTEDAYDEDYGYDYWDVDKTVDEGFCHCGEKWDMEEEE